MKTRTKVFIGLLLSIFVSISIYIIVVAGSQKLDLAKINNLQLSTRIYDVDKKEAATLSGGINREYTKLYDLPDFVPLAFIAAEDVRFYSHNGIDVRRIFGAALANIKSASYAQGASTITQQLIKLTHLSNKKTISRKIREAWLALQLERQMTKDEILEAYLNVVYFGGGAYGIGTAAQRYFSKPPSELTLSEAALLAGIIKAPSNYAPHINMSNALERRDYILKTMEKEGFITAEELAEAISEQIELDETEYYSAEYGWYADSAANEACGILGITYEELLGGGYSIYTSLNTDVQNAVNAAVTDNSFFPEEAAQTAVVAIDPETGGVIAICGGRKYVRRGLNRATDSRRQPGSLIKPFTAYAAAVDKYGYLPTSTVYDVQRTYPDGYAPGNAGNKYYGRTSLRTALSRSLNAATVDLADTIGVQVSAEYAEKFGIAIEKDDINLALMLGSMLSGVTPLEMCAAYSTLADSGIYNEPYFVESIADRDGRIIYTHDYQSKRAVSEETACILNDMLITTATEGTAKSLADIGVTLAAKTGTAGLENGDTSDIWASVYTPAIAVTVWIGKDYNTDGGMAKSVSGSGYAVPMCKSIFESIPSDSLDAAFAIPEGLTRVLIDKFALDKKGQIYLAAANTPSEYVSTELFRNIEELTVSDIWDAPAPVNDLQLISSAGDIPTLKFTPLSEYAEYIILRKNGNKTETAGILEYNSGNPVIFKDTQADVSNSNTYTVIARHKLLNDYGITLTGSESISVTSQPKGILNRLSSVIETNKIDTEIETNIDPMF